MIKNADLSVRLRLTLWYFLVFSLAGGALCAGSWLALRQSLHAVILYQLGERLDDIHNTLELQPPTATVAMLQDQFAPYAARDEGKWLKIKDQSGHWIFRSTRSFGDAPAPALSDELLHRALVQTFRYATRRHSDRQGISLTRMLSVHGHLYTIQIGVSETTDEALLHLFARNLLVSAPVLLCMAALLGYLASRKALEPIRQLASSARQISGQRIDLRLPVSAARDEIAHLSETLNGMLDRIESGVRSTREFTANAAHELRTPLSLIRTELEVTLSLPRSGSTYRDSCGNVLQEVARMAALIDKLLVLARADAGADALQLEYIDAASMARKVADSWRSRIRSAFLHFRVTGEGPLPILADLSSMQRLLHALIENAVRYTPEGGLITLAVCEQDDQVIFSVCDTGIGISSEHLPHIFERFYRVDSARSRKLGGSGLGLTLAQWTATRHGSRITVESTPSRGSCFRFSMNRYLGRPPLVRQ